MKFYTIPVFVPELACPNRCVFCNQNSISGCLEQPGMVETEQIIEERLKTIPGVDSHIEIGFFGGNFTGIEKPLQQDYLSIANRYLSSGRVQGIRISTRPDYIDPQALRLLKEYGVTTIELGAQSMDEEVLRLAGRGHTVNDIEKASGLIRENGFSLGLQMMTGLPGDTTEKSIHTAKRIIELGAENTRIYPTLVIKNTKLAGLWEKGLYKPQSLDEAVTLTATLLEIFKYAGVKVIRAGLHPSEELVYGGEMLAGPYHPNFRQLAETEVWRRKFTQLTEPSLKNSDQHTSRANLNENAPDFSVNDDILTIFVPENELHAAIGYNCTNKSLLERYFCKVEYKIREGNHSDKPLIIADKRMPLPAKNKLKNFGQVFFLEDQFTVYKTIAGHPDIFICVHGNKVIMAPDMDSKIKASLSLAGYEVIEGRTTPGKGYPESAVYNAVVTSNLLIHNLRITDPVLLETFNDKEKIHVNQGYTRCNLLPLNDTCFITSDKGIEKILNARGFEVLFVDPQPVLLKGQKHGFFPGCCGIWDDKVIINGNLRFHPQGLEIEEFINNHSIDNSKGSMQIISLYDGPLRDIGSIFFFKGEALNQMQKEKNQRISTIFESAKP